ncbi:MAG: altronate oxidoreductase [Sphingobacteriales bacterium]|nr:altronate oxidoreductase [Sphingobacteriales bacterium]
MKLLSRFTLKNIDPQLVTIPQSSLLELPEKVLQFGTGVLLRGLPDYFIDKANRQGIFNGRVAVVKSTSTGGADDFEKQDCLYTLCIRGIEKGENVTENIISSAISRVLSADKDWHLILEIAHNPQLQLVVSNTTEVGIQLVKENIHQHPPASFPGKLLAVLYERFKAFLGSESSGLIIIATELIPDNGKKLESIVLELAHLNNLEDAFIDWLEKYNTFCNSLVDRIVPGKPDAETLEALENSLGYTDKLLSIAEPYRLWAIEGDEKVASVLSFGQADEGVIVKPDIEIYRELKVRLLNGTHTLTAAMAFLAGKATVKEAMADADMLDFIQQLMFNEIIPAIPYKVPVEIANNFASAVIDRFSNPSLEHLWLNITFQYTMKMKIRVLPLILNHYKLFNKVPEYMALGFAAYLVFLRPVKKEGNQYFGSCKGEDYLIVDDQAAYYFDKIHNTTAETYIVSVLADTSLWSIDLTQLPEFTTYISEVYAAYNECNDQGTLKKLRSRAAKTV